MSHEPAGAPAKELVEFSSRPINSRPHTQPTPEMIPSAFTSKEVFLEVPLHRCRGDRRELQQFYHLYCYLDPERHAVRHVLIGDDRAILDVRMTIRTKSMMRRRVNRALPSGLVCP